MGLVGGSTLPVSKGIGQAVVRLASSYVKPQYHLHVGHHGLLGEKSVTGAVGELVPAVSGTNQDTLGDLVHDMGDVGVELRSGQVSAVESLGTDGDGVDDVLVTGDGLLNGGPVAREGRLGQQIVGVGRLANPI